MHSHWTAGRCADGVGNMAQVNPLYEHQRPRASARPAKAISVLLVDDHVLFRQALRHLLEAESDIRVVGEAGDGRSAEALAERYHPDVVLMDISMPGIDGVAATRNLKSDVPGVKVVILTMFAEDGHVIRAIRAGADAYLLKNTESARVIDAIRAVARGESVIEPQLATKLLT